MAGADEFRGMLKPADSPTDILAPVFANTNLSLLDIVKLQTQVLVPVLKAFRAELGDACGLLSGLEH